MFQIFVIGDEPPAAEFARTIDGAIAFVADRYATAVFKVQPGLWQGQSDRGESIFIREETFVEDYENHDDDDDANWKVPDTDVNEHQGPPFEQGEHDTLEDALSALTTSELEKTLLSALHDSDHRLAEACKEQWAERNSGLQYPFKEAPVDQSTPPEPCDRADWLAARYPSTPKDPFAEFGEGLSLADWMAKHYPSGFRAEDEDETGLMPGDPGYGE